MKKRPEVTEMKRKSPTMPASYSLASKLRCAPRTRLLYVCLTELS
ncbi:Uncharacterized protein APZ42_031676 [Daphnia magna]|uniref:Uncharacterized protein n=1 Tax=Daphnia magna TaxID=35525 RepID=A0A164MJE6_9CRUS|nr:Uncharacterized protein APZ42_031676 [Daphnia magna]